MVKTGCQNIIEDLKKFFPNSPYPSKDFYQAIADRDYLDVSNLNPNDDIKKWDDIDLKILLKYYDFLLFLDITGQKYYLPAYITILLKHKDIQDTWIFDTSMQVLVEIDCNIFSFEQKSIILDSLQCIDRICNNCDREMLQVSIDKYTKC